MHKLYINEVKMAFSLYLTYLLCNLYFIGVNFVPVNCSLFACFVLFCFVFFFVATVVRNDNGDGNDNAAKQQA